MRCGYSTDLTNSEWSVIQRYFPRAKKTRSAAKTCKKYNCQRNFVYFTSWMCVAAASIRFPATQDGLLLFLTVIKNK